MAVVIDGPNDTINVSKMKGNVGTGTITFNADNTTTLNSNISTDVTNNFLFTQTNTTTIPATGKTTMWSKGIAGRGFLAAMGPSGMDYAIQPSLWRQKVARWNPSGVATVAVPGVDGMGVLTAIGTASGPAITTTSVATRQRRMKYLGAATAAAFAGIFQPVAQWTTGSGNINDGAGFFFSIRFSTSDAAAVAGARMFVGMSSTVGAPTNVEPNTLLNSIGIAQLSTDTTQLYLVYGGSVAQAAIALGTGFPASINNTDAYDFSLFSPPNANGVINYRLDRLNTGTFIEGTITPGTPGTQTPLSTTLLAPRAWRCNNATLLACAIDITNIYLETDF